MYGDAPMVLNSVNSEARFPTACGPGSDQFAGTAVSISPKPWRVSTFWPGAALLEVEHLSGHDGGAKLLMWVQAHAVRVITGGWFRKERCLKTETGVTAV